MGFKATTPRRRPSTKYCDLAQIVCRTAETLPFATAPYATS